MLGQFEPSGAKPIRAEASLADRGKPSWAEESQAEPAKDGTTNFFVCVTWCFVPAKLVFPSREATCFQAVPSQGQPSQAKQRPPSRAEPSQLGMSQANARTCLASPGQARAEASRTQRELNQIHPRWAEPGSAEPAWDPASQFFLLRNRLKIHMRTVGS